jgi:rfaE bifunctional protein kinase chain/domain
VTPSQLSDLLSRLRSVSIGVVGDFCLDAYWQLDEAKPELSLETGKPTLAVAEQHYSLGGAGNVVNNLASLGTGKVHAFGVLDDDLFGGEMLRHFEEINTDTAGLIRQPSEWQTCVYAKPYLGSEELNRFDFGRFNTLSGESERKLIAAITEGIPDLDALVVNQQIPRSVFTPTVVKGLNDLASHYPKKVFLLDSRNKVNDFGSMICKVNAIEAAALFGKKIERNEECTMDELSNYAKRLFDRFRKPVFITRSRLGLLLFDGIETVEIPALHYEGPIDPVGAGDTVVAAIAAALAAGANPHQAGSVAMIAAAITIRKLRQTGTATPEGMLELAQHSPSTLHS